MLLFIHHSLFYSLLTVDAGYYLPSFKTINCYFMKALIAGEKKAIKTAEVKYIYAPQYASLSVQRILQFAQEYQAIAAYLPAERDIP